MGVKELWTVLSPISEKKSLWELKNKSIAIDLSAWICDSQNVGDNSQRNMYLRNLFFRTSFLLLLGAKPIFVLEGAAPELKHKTIIARSQVRNGNKDVAKSSSRANLKSLQKQCEKLLKTMGISCVQGIGEAEAYCAWLNNNGIVDAVITQDSDCFLYGAETIYRNFTMSPTYTCDAYSISVIKKKLNLGRNKLLALSLLCGCDYDKGVNGVGKESALKFLSTLEEHEVLDRLRSWRSNSEYDLMEKKIVRNLTPALKLELAIRKKALQVPDFPSEDIIKEYLYNEYSETAPQISWLQPDLLSFLKIAEKQLNWDEQYTIEKFFPLTTRWHLLHPTARSFVLCETILKKRVVRGVNSYECRWSAPELTLGETDIGLVTTEPQDLVYNAYSDMVEEYLNSKTKKTKKGTKATTRKKKTDKENVPNDETKNIEKLFHNLSIDEEKLTQVKDKQPNKKRVKNILTVSKGLQTLDKYMKPCTDKRVFSELDELSRQLIGSASGVDSLMHSTPKRTTAISEVAYVDTANCNVSYHYNSDFSHSPSPLKHKNRASMNSSSVRLNEKSISKCSTDISERWSLSNYVSTQENREIKGNTISKLDESMTASFLNITNIDDDDFNMSDIINSIVNNKENGAISNPALKIILNSNKNNNNVC